ncbi:MAG: DUF523 domain-containing protein [Synergistetes bacterium]|nr:DUF523 domain-containing protein [Synergistota bacterium]
MIGVSACLLGIPCRYDGKSKVERSVLQLFLRGIELFPVCPESWGGLSSPRPPAEIVGGDGKAVWRGNARVLDRTGKDLTAFFIRGAQRVLKVSRALHVSGFILKERSPSCGVNFIYDGTFSGKVKRGSGVLAYILRENGYKVISELEINRICEILGDIYV